MRLHTDKLLLLPLQSPPPLPSTPPVGVTSASGSLSGSTSPRPLPLSFPGVPERPRNAPAYRLDGVVNEKKADGLVTAEKSSIRFCESLENGVSWKEGTGGTNYFSHQARGSSALSTLGVVVSSPSDPTATSACDSVNQKSLHYRRRSWNSLINRSRPLLAEPVAVGPQGSAGLHEVSC